LTPSAYRGARAICETIGGVAVDVESTSATAAHGEREEHHRNRFAGFHLALGRVLEA
jgi:hypothetical protein